MTDKLTFERGGCVPPVIEIGNDGPELFIPSIPLSTEFNRYLIEDRSVELFGKYGFSTTANRCNYCGSTGKDNRGNCGSCGAPK